MLIERAWSFGVIYDVDDLQLDGCWFGAAGVASCDGVGEKCDNKIFRASCQTII